MDKLETAVKVNMDDKEHLNRLEILIRDGWSINHACNIFDDGDLKYIIFNLHRTF